jgi:uncharacterized glyoxalase superfamily protein PhnB
MPRCTVIPELAYPDVTQAAEWLCRGFGFTMNLRFANHRMHLNIGDGAIALTELGTNAASDGAHSMLIRVENADAHHEHSSRNGAHILSLPRDNPFGERQYTAEDFAGHRWTFSESVKDVDPREWEASQPVSRSLKSVRPRLQ